MDVSYYFMRHGANKCDGVINKLKVTGRVLESR